MHLIARRIKGVTGNMSIGNSVHNTSSIPSVRASLMLAFPLAAIVGAVVVWSARADMGCQGKISTVDGVRTVSNPAKGYAQPLTVDMPELWHLGGDTNDEDEFFGVIRDIDVDEQGNAYLLDNQLREVKIYTKDGIFVRSIGREGEGPGEFRNPISIFFTGDGKIAVAQSMPAKIVLLTEDGQPTGKRPIPRPEDGGVQIIERADSRAGNTVLFLAGQVDDLAGGKTSRMSRIVSVDATGKSLCEYTSRENVISFPGGKLRETTHDNIERWEIGPDGKVYVCESYANYEITVYTRDGKVDKVITRDYRHVARPPKEMGFAKRYWGHWAATIPGCKAVVEETAKDIEQIYVLDDGSLWVLTSAGARDLPEGTLGVFDVFHPEGHFVRTVTLRGEGDPLQDLYVFAKDHFFVVTDFQRAQMTAWGAQDLYDDTDEEESEPMAVTCYKLEHSMSTGR